VELTTTDFPLEIGNVRFNQEPTAGTDLSRSRCLLGEHASIDHQVSKAERKYRLPRGLLAAVVEVESNGRVHRISSAGAMGPARLTPTRRR
jgi:hypothetical protein